MLRENLKVMYQAMQDLQIIDDMTKQKVKLRKDTKIYLAEFSEKYKMTPGSFRVLLEKIICQINPDKI